MPERLFWPTLVGLAFLASPSVPAEELKIALAANRPVETTIDSPLDDSNYREPHGYEHHGRAIHVFQKKLTLTNTGTVPCRGRLLVVNDQNWSSAENLRASLRLPTEPGTLMPRLFEFWREHISHADPDAAGTKEPFSTLNFWSYSLCGDATAGLSRLAAIYGVPARKLALNGHVAAEYFYDGSWHVLDSDQNAFYLRLENRTPASAAELRADPFLIRRTKAYGRHALVEPIPAAFNASLLEYVTPVEEPPLKKKPLTPVRPDLLYPGEQLIVYADRPPAHAIGKTDLRRWGEVREAALREVEWIIRPAARPKTGDRAKIETAWPILRTVNHTTHEVILPPPGEAVFQTEIKVSSPEDQVSVLCQVAAAALPWLGKGRNRLLLDAEDPRATASLQVEWVKAPELPIPAVTITPADPAPTFHLQTDAENLWWQISATPDFLLVAPNFDQVGPAEKQLVIDPLSATFLNPGQKYHLRAKAGKNGVWGEWSTPIIFQVEKPPRPAPVAVAATPRGRLRLSWPDSGAGTEYLVFGSNRLDFVPEIFSPDEYVRLRNQFPEETRPNKNLLTTAVKPEVELEPKFHFYRVIARRAGVLSVPGDLVTAPAALTTNLPAPMVLQNRWSRTKDPNPNATTEEYLATEVPLR